jgi:hypothetical protein
MPIYEFLEAEGIKYAIRLPANQVLQSRQGATRCSLWPARTRPLY